jgi:hypothetical protein
MRESDVADTQQVNMYANTDVKSVTSFATDASEESVAMSIIKVRLRKTSKPQNEVVVYAALDSMSTACFIAKDFGVCLAPLENLLISLLKLCL